MFISLRNHTTYSLSKGSIKIPELITKATDLKIPAVGISDCLNLSGALEFSIEAKNAGIQPIIGCEVLVDFAAAPGASNHEISLAKTPLIAINQEGYQNLMYLVSHSFLNRHTGIDPHISFALLKEHSSGLIALSGSVEGIIAKLTIEAQTIKLQSITSELREAFAERFFIEITRHKTKLESQLEPKFLELALSAKLPIVATNDVYFLNKETYEAQDILMCIGSAKYLTDETRARLSCEQYFKTPKEMAELFADLPEAIENTVNIAKRCVVMAQKRKPSLPEFKSESASSEEELKKQAELGLNERLRQKFINENTSPDDQQKITEQYYSRLRVELGIITKVQFADYFLIVSDFVKWSKDHQIPVGPGRGSGAGSIVAWSLKITDLDPIRFGLLFERFLNPERVSMPDFDIDFCQDRRDEVITYVQQKYGKEYVAQIITFGKLQARAVLKDVGRVLQMPYMQVDRICKLIPFNAIEAVTLGKAIEMDKDLQSEIRNSPEVTKLVDIALKLEGLNRHSSTHAAGIVIGDKKLYEICALYQDEGATMPAVSYSMKYAEEVGLVKFDFLGLKTLTVIAEAVKLIERTRGIKIDISNIPLNDNKTFEMLASGDSVGVFQIESLGMRSTLRQMKADKIEDIIALISLYRPGPMDNIPTYIRRKLGEEKITYLHPLLADTLKETYGVIVYQEQVMEIAKVLSGYSLAAADLLRRAMGKKNKEEMDKQREIFASGAAKNGVNERTALEIFEFVDKFAGYGFNKSHAAAYAMISYQTAYLKANFTEEFLVASINLELDNSEKVSNLIQAAKDNGIPILPPDINASSAYFTIEAVS